MVCVYVHMFMHIPDMHTYNCYFYSIHTCVSLLYSDVHVLYSFDVLQLLINERRTVEPYYTIVYDYKQCYSALCTNIKTYRHKTRRTHVCCGHSPCAQYHAIVHTKHARNVYRCCIHYHHYNVYSLHHICRLFSIPIMQL